MDGIAAKVMVTDFPVVDANTTVAEAEVCLESSTMSGLPVLNPDKTVFGILTAQNLAHFHRRPLNNPRAVYVWEICDARPLVVDQFSTLDKVTDTVLQLRSEYVLVVNDKSHPVGMIQAETLLNHWLMSARSARSFVVSRHKKSGA